MNKKYQRITRDALLKAIALAGSQRKLAKLCGITQPYIHNWLHRNKMTGIPVEYVLTIEKALEGRITRHEMRPDIYPD